MKKLFNNKGAALVEYAVLLSFISAIALAFVGSGGLGSSISGAVNKASNAINMILGINEFNEGAFKDALIGLKDSEFKSVEHDHGGKHAILGSDFIRDNLFTDETYKNSLENSQKFAEEYLSKINFGDVPAESWRFLNEGELNQQYAYLIWSDTKWGEGGFDADKTTKTACMYARIDKATNKVEYGVAYANPLAVHAGNGTINGGDTNGGGMVNISQGLTSNLKFDNNWYGDNMNNYLASESPYFTSDYNTAANLYKELQTQSQQK